MRSVIPSHYIAGILVFLAAAAYFSFGISSIGGPFDYDEAVYLEVSRQMAQSGDYILPSYNYEKFYEKPPLLYWCVSVAARVFFPGRDITYCARLVQTLAAAATAALIYIFAFYISGKISGGVLSALVFVSAFGEAALSRAILTDGIFTLMLTAAVFSGVVFVDSGKRKFSLAFWFFSALATLAKGPAGAVLATGSVFLCALYHRRWSFSDAVKIFVDPPGVVLFLALSLPWYVAAHIKSGGESTRNFIFVHNLKRFASASFEGHSGGVFYYIPVIMVWFFPWIFFLPQAIYDGLKGAMLPDGKKDFFMYCIISAALPFFIFSISKTKLPNYAAPLFPYLAVITGLFVSEGYVLLSENNFGKPTVRWIRDIPGLVAGVVAGLALVLVFGAAPLWFNKNIERFKDALPFLCEGGVFRAGVSFGIISLAVFIAMVCGAGLLFFRSNKRKIFAWMVSASLAGGLLIPYAAKDVWDFVQKPLMEVSLRAADLGRKSDGNYMIVAYKLMMSPSVVFYTGQKVNFISEGEMDLITRSQREGKDILVIASKKDFLKNAEPMGFSIIKESAGYAVFARRKNEI